jgi:hypothetical protein
MKDQRKCEATYHEVAGAMHAQYELGHARASHAGVYGDECSLPMVIKWLQVYVSCSPLALLLLLLLLLLTRQLRIFLRLLVGGCS